MRDKRGDRAAERGEVGLKHIGEAFAVSVVDIYGCRAIVAEFARQPRQHNALRGVGYGGAIQVVVVFKHGERGGSGGRGYLDDAVGDGYRVGDGERKAAADTTHDSLDALRLD